MSSLDWYVLQKRKIRPWPLENSQHYTSSKSNTHEAVENDIWPEIFLPFLGKLLKSNTVIYVRNHKKVRAISVWHYKHNDMPTFKNMSTGKIHWCHNPMPSNQIKWSKIEKKQQKKILLRPLSHTAICVIHTGTQMNTPCINMGSMFCDLLACLCMSIQAWMRV